MTVQPIRALSGKDLASTYRTYLLQSGYAPGTVEVRLRLLARMPKAPQEMTPDDVVGMLGADLSPSSRKVYLGYMRSIYRDLMTLGLATHDPSASVRLGRTGRNQPRPLGPSQVEMIMGAKRTREWEWSVLGLYAGLRASDVVSLYPEDLVETDTGWGLQLDGKGNVRAIIPAHPLVVEVIQSHGPRGPLWRLTAQSMSSRWAEWANQLGLGVLRFHQCRHTFATRLYAATGDLLLVRDAMRHASVAATQIYAQMDARRTSQAVTSL